MAKLYWLKTIQPCKLELRPLTDYAGQPLIFTTPGTSFSRRCVTEEVRNSLAVITYINRQIIADEQPVVSTVPVVVTKPTPAPVPVTKPTSTPAATTASISVPEPVSEPELTSATIISEPESTPENTTNIAEINDTPTEENSDTRRGRRHRNR